MKVPSSIPRIPRTANTVKAEPADDAMLMKRKRKDSNKRQRKIVILSGPAAGTRNAKGKGKAKEEVYDTRLPVQEDKAEGLPEVEAMEEYEEEEIGEADEIYEEDILPRKGKKGKKVSKKSNNQSSHPLNEDTMFSRVPDLEQHMIDSVPMDEGSCWVCSFYEQDCVKRKGSRICAYCSTKHLKCSHNRIEGQYWFPSEHVLNQLVNRFKRNASANVVSIDTDEEESQAEPAAPAHPPAHQPGQMAIRTTSPSPVIQQPYQPRQVMRAGKWPRPPVTANQPPSQNPLPPASKKAENLVVRGSRTLRKMPVRQSPMGVSAASSMGPGHPSDDTAGDVQTGLPPVPLPPPAASRPTVHVSTKPHVLLAEVDQLRGDIKSLKNLVKAMEETQREMVSTQKGLSLTVEGMKLQLLEHMQGPSGVPPPRPSPILADHPKDQDGVNIK